MSVQNAPQVKTMPEDELSEQVEQFLKTHPEFFRERPQLLAELEVSHACGTAVSLIEHQVHALRGQNRQLRKRMQELLNNARDNQELSTKLHRLTLELMDCDQLDQVLSLLYAALQDDLAAERVSIRLFDSPVDAQNAGLAEFMKANEVTRELMDDLSRNRGPLTGRMRASVAELLFAEEVGSGIILQLGDLQPFGVLAVANRDPQRYQPGMGTLFMQQLADIAQQLIRRHLAQ